MNFKETYKICERNVNFRKVSCVLENKQYTGKVGSEWEREKAISRRRKAAVFLICGLHTGQ